MSYIDRLGLSPEEQIATARQAGSYQRLKARFESADVKDGLRPDGLVLGDVFDVGLLYSVLVRGEERFLPSMHNLVWLVEQFNPEVSVKDEIAPLGTTEDLDSLDRNSNFFNDPINLDELMRNPFSIHETEFEITHNPGGIQIQRVLGSVNRYMVRLPNLNGTEPSFYGDVFKETGLPVEQNTSFMRRF